MTERKKQNDEQARPQEEYEDEAPETAEEESPETLAEAVEDLMPAQSAEYEEEEEEEQGQDDPLAVLREEAESLRDQLLRALAEVENTRRRAQKDKQEAARYAPAPLARDLLAVSDNLSRALQSVPEELAKSDERVKSLIDGLEMTRRELQGVFEKHDIVKIEPFGEKLNPHHHEAMFEIEDTSQEPGTVLQVIEPGYLLHDRLLRPARVGVAKGGPKGDAKARAKEAPQAPANEDAEPEEGKGEDKGASKE